MKYRSFGTLGWQVSEIGFGGWQPGGTWGTVDKSESIETLLYAFEQGVNFVDTAVLYGPHQQVEGSLERLQVERIDLLQLHSWIPRGTVELDWLETLNDLRLQGRIDQIGVSLRDIRPHQGLDVARLGLVASIQVMYNIFEQEPAEELFPTGLERDTAFIARVPFDSGALTGTWDENTYGQWAEDDKRHQMYRGDRFRQMLERVNAVEKATRPYFGSLAEAAMRFSLHHPAVSIVIPGMRDKREVAMNVAYSDGQPFPEELATTLRPYAWKHEYYD